MEKEIVYLAMYNPDINESSYGVISAHKTKTGAENAIATHKEIQHKEWLELYPTKKDQKEFPFARWEDWCVFDIEILE